MNIYEGTYCVNKFSLTPNNKELHQTFINIVNSAYYTQHVREGTNENHQGWCIVLVQYEKTDVYL